MASGFKEDFRGDDKPPATQYRLKDDAGGFYAEFLMPLVGSELTRDGKRKATSRVAGVTVQRLRHLDLLLQHPWSVELKPGEFQVEAQKVIRIANPVSFVAQKLLIHRRRDRADKAKDVLYIHDTLQVFGSRLDELRDEWTDRILPQLQSNAVRAVARAPEWLFAKTSEPIREAAAIAMDRRLSPEALRESCRYGLEQVFG